MHREVPERRGAHAHNMRLRVYHVAHIGLDIEIGGTYGCSHAMVAAAGLAVYPAAS